MTETTTVAFDVEEQELQLAKLACAKLAGLVQGAVSIGLPGLVTGVPEPSAFFRERFRIMAGFALVLHTVSGKPEKILRLRDRSRAVMTALDQFQDCLLKYLDAPAGSGRPLQPSLESVLSLCDAIGAYAALVNLDGTMVAKVKEVVLQVFEAIASESPVSGATGG